MKSFFEVCWDGFTWVLWRIDILLGGKDPLGPRLDREYDRENHEDYP